MTVLYDEGYVEFFEAVDALKSAVSRIGRESMPRPLYADGTPVRCTDEVMWKGRRMGVSSIEWTGDRGPRPSWLVWLYDVERDADCDEPWRVFDESLVKLVDR